jgi:thiosulfate dehydrogenase [quinone] large subunit
MVVLEHERGELDLQEANVLGKSAPTRRGPKVCHIWAVLRIALGWVFLWAFLDKLLALGFATGRLEDGGIDFFGNGAAALNGGSPTSGFLTYASRGPLGGFYRSLASSGWVDWLFMAGLLGIGVALILGVGLRVAAVTGSVLMLMMWSAALWPENNPVVDDHIIYALVLVVLAAVRAGDTWGFGRAWGRTRLVRRFPALQ